MASPNSSGRRSANDDDNKNYVCDTIPPRALRFVAAEPSSRPPEFRPQPNLRSETAMSAPLAASAASLTLAQPRQLCVRHQRMADEGTNLRLQQSLDALPVEERAAVNAIWSNFSASSHPRRALILRGLLTMCCFSQLSLLAEQLSHLIRIDPFSVLPREVSLKVLGYLDATSLCRAAQVNQKWRTLADDDILWRGICEQHIGQKCLKCGWGLPVLEKRRTYVKSPAPSEPTPLPSSSKRRLEDSPEDQPPLKRARSEPHTSDHEQSSSDDDSQSGACSQACSTLVPPAALARSPSATRPWKDVYSERMTIERNWRKSRYRVKILKGHRDGVMCLQFSESLSHPSFPVVITGSYDRTARVWNLDTGKQLHCLQGHTRAVRALQFDDVKLITGSMDSTMRVWDWRRGNCIRTLTGHTEGVICLNFDSNVLASGSADSTIKVWNLRTGGAFTLRGHQEWVNSVQLWDSNDTSSPSTNTSLFDTPGCGAPQIDPGKMLFSGSDDGTIRLWDLVSRSCVRTFTGHMSQVQSMKLLTDPCGEDLPPPTNEDGSPAPAPTTLTPTRRKPVLISGSLDNTIRMWDIETGVAVSTWFGHIEGVWSVASDKMRTVSGSHDRTIKVWSREDGSCTSTLVGHTAAVTCVALGEDKIISGSDDCDVRVWDFSG